MRFTSISNELALVVEAFFVEADDFLAKLVKCDVAGELISHGSSTVRTEKSYDTMPDPSNDWLHDVTKPLPDSTISTHRNSTERRVLSAGDE
jgi:hypothetical protein